MVRSVSERTAVEVALGRVIGGTVAVMGQTSTPTSRRQTRRSKTNSQAADKDGKSNGSHDKQSAISTHTVALKQDGDSQGRKSMTFLDTPRRTPLRLYEDEQVNPPKSPSPLGDVFMGPLSSAEKKKRSHRSYSDVSRRRTLALARVDEVGTRRNHHSLDSSQYRQAKLVQNEGSDDANEEGEKANREVEAEDERDRDEEDEVDGDEEEDTSDESLSSSEDEMRDSQMTAKERQNRAERRLTRDLVRRFSSLPRPSLLFGPQAEDGKQPKSAPHLDKTSSRAALGSPRSPRTRAVMVLQRTWRTLDWKQKRRRACITIQTAFRKRMQAKASQDVSGAFVQPASSRPLVSVEVHTSDDTSNSTPVRNVAKTTRMSGSQEKTAPHPRTLKVGPHSRTVQQVVQKDGQTRTPKVQNNGVSHIPTLATSSARREATAKTASYLSATASSLNRVRIDSDRSLQPQTAKGVGLKSRVPMPVSKVTQKPVVELKPRVMPAKVAPKQRIIAPISKTSQSSTAPQQRTAHMPSRSLGKAMPVAEVKSKSTSIRPVSSLKTQARPQAVLKPESLEVKNQVTKKQDTPTDARSLDSKVNTLLDSGHGISSPKLPPIQHETPKRMSSDVTISARQPSSVKPGKHISASLASPAQLRLTPANQENVLHASIRRAIESKGENASKAEFSIATKRIGLALTNLNAHRSPSPKKRIAMGPVPARQALGVPGGIGSGGLLMSKALSPLKPIQPLQADGRPSTTSPAGAQRLFHLTTTSAEHTPREVPATTATPFASMSLAERLNAAGMQARKAMGKDRSTPSSSFVGGPLRPAPRSALRGEESTGSFTSSSNGSYKTFPPLSAAQLQKITRANTERNGFCFSKYEVSIIRKDCPRPPSPSTKISKAFGRLSSYSAVGREARAKRRAVTRNDDEADDNDGGGVEEDDDDGDDEDDMHLQAPPQTTLDGRKQLYAMGAGENEVWEGPAPKASGSTKKSVNWDKSLVLPVFRLNSPSTVRAKERGLRKLVLTPCQPSRTKLVRSGVVVEGAKPLTWTQVLDPLGNHLQALESFSPNITSGRTIKVSKYIYQGE